MKREKVEAIDVKTGKRRPHELIVPETPAEAEEVAKRRDVEKRLSFGDVASIF